MNIQEKLCTGKRLTHSDALNMLTENDVIYWFSQCDEFGENCIFDLVCCLQHFRYEFESEDIQQFVKTFFNILDSQNIPMHLGFN
jgi:hypothetical protein